ncbi:glycosyltransferase, partial [Streptomyces sp. SID7499]|nr:glycosyltransferase [Streptomyces sp. SID7499]
EQPLLTGACMRAGVGVHLPKSARSDWPALLESAWRDDALRDRARTLGRRLAAMDGAARAADIVERVAGHSAIPKEDHDYANVRP